MMNITLIKTLLTTVLILPLLCQAGENQQTFLARYLVHVNGQPLGRLWLQSRPDGFEANYYGALAQSDLPFYNKRKTASVKEGAYLKSMHYGDKPFSFYHIYENLGGFPPRVMDAIKGDKRNHSVITDAEGLPRFVFDRMPCGSLEFLLVALVKGTLKPLEHFMLFEAASGNVFRVYLQDAGQSSPSNKPCKTRQLTCYRTNVPGQDDNALFDIWLSEKGIPFIVRSRSNRWSFELNGFNPDPDLHYERVDVATKRKDILKRVLQAKLSTMIQITLQPGKLSHQLSEFQLEARIKYSYTAMKKKAQLDYFVRNKVFKNKVHHLNSGLHWQENNDRYWLAVSRDAVIENLRRISNNRSFQSNSNKLTEESEYLEKRIDFAEFKQVVELQIPDCSLAVIDSKKKQRNEDLSLTCGEFGDSISLEMLARNYLKIKINGSIYKHAQLVKKVHLNDAHDIVLQYTQKLVSKIETKQAFTSETLRETARIIFCSMLTNSSQSKQLEILLEPMIIESNEHFLFTIPKQNLDMETLKAYTKATARKLKKQLTKIKGLEVGSIETALSDEFTLFAPVAISLDAVKMDREITELLKKQYPNSAAIWEDEMILKEKNYWKIPRMEGLENVHSDCL